MLDPGQLRSGSLGEVGDSVDGRQTCTALQSGRERLAEQFRPESLGQPSRRIKTRRAGGVTTDQNRCRFTGPKSSRDRVTVTDRCG